MTAADGQRYRRLSLWLDTVEDDLTPRPALAGDCDVDVAIVGGGFTGLWTAYALLQHDPTLSILVLERDIAGFGASGRNGGWCSDLFPVTWERLERQCGRAAANAMHRAMVDGIGDVAATLEREGIDADMLRGGQLTVARTPLQETELRAKVARSRPRDDPDLALSWLDAGEVAARVRVSDCRGAAFTPNCARIHPAKLVRGLARAVERSGGRIAEQTAVLEVLPHRAVTTRGTVRARHVVRATEAYTTTLRGERRALLPLYSLMIATEPLPEDAWAQVGWSRGETLNDGRHLLIYAQRTGDGRIAFGGRGAPYHFGSRISDEFDRDPAVFKALEDALHELVPPDQGCLRHPSLGWPHRGGKGLATVSRHRSFCRHRLGRWVRRRRGDRSQCRRSHHRGPHSGARLRADPVAVGPAQVTALGARTSALAGRQPRRARDAGCGRAGTAHRQAIVARASGHPAAGTLATGFAVSGQRLSMLIAW